MRRPLTFAMLVVLCGCRSPKATLAADAGAPAAVPTSVVLDASALLALDASTADAPPHVATEAERTYLRKLRALAYRCKQTHAEIPCTEGRLRALDVPGLHCGHAAVAPDLRFALAASHALADATPRKYDAETYWVETRSLVQADDIDRIDQEPMFMDSSNDKILFADAYDGNSVIGGAYHVRLRHPVLSAAERARVRALSKVKGPGDSGQIDLAVLQGDTIFAIAVVDWKSTTERQLIVHGAPLGRDTSGLCATKEAWELPEDLETAFDPAP